MEWGSHFLFDFALLVFISSSKNRSKASRSTGLADSTPHPRRCPMANPGSSHASVTGVLPVP